MKIRVSSKLKAKLTEWFATQSMLTFHIQTDSLDEASASNASANAAAAAAAASGAAIAAGSMNGLHRELSIWQRFKRWFGSLCIHQLHGGHARSKSPPSATATTDSAGAKKRRLDGGVSAAPASALSTSPIDQKHCGSSPADVKNEPGIDRKCNDLPLVTAGEAGSTTTTITVKENSIVPRELILPAAFGRRPSSITSRYFPRDVWVAVFRYLSVPEFVAIAPTCKLMRALSGDRVVWRAVTDFRSLANKIPPIAQINKIFDRLQHLNAISFVSFSGAVRRRLLLASDDVLGKLARACPQLQVANLLGFSVSDVGVRALAENCPKLNSLFLSQSSISDKGLNMMIAACQLNRLSLAHCRQLTEDGLRIIGDALSLQHLSLADTAVTENTIRTGLLNCLSLRSIYLSFTVVTDAGLRLLTSLPVLDTVQLQCCARITDTGVWDVANLCRSLTSLDISGNPQLTDETIAEFGSSKVRFLTVSACPNITAAARGVLAERGVAIFDDPDFCSELVEAEVAAEVYNKLELLAMADGYASVAEFVRIYMAAFLEQNQQRRTAGGTGASAAATAAVPAAAMAAPTGPTFGCTTPTNGNRPQVQPPLPTHHLIP